MQQAADNVTWAQRQTEHTLRLLHGNENQSDRHAQDSKGCNQQLWSSLTRLNGMLYVMHSDEGHPRGCWRRTTMDRYRAPIETWSIVIDFDQLSAEEKIAWLSCGQWTLPPKHEKAIIQLRDETSGRYVLRDWDLKAGAETIGESFSLTARTPSEVSWLDEDTVLLMCTLDEDDDRTEVGRSRTVRLWKRGTAAGCAPVIFAVRPDHVCARAFRDWSCAGERIVYIDEASFGTIIVHVGPRDGSLKQLPIPESAGCVLRGEYIAICLRENWPVNGQTYNAGMIVGCSMRDLLMDAARPVQLCNASGFQDALMDSHHLVMLFCRNFHYSTRVFRPGQSWSEVVTKALPAGTVMSIATLDRFAGETDDTILLTAQGPLMPPSFWVSPIPGGQYDFMRQAPETFQAISHTVTDHYTTNRRGESIAYILVAPQPATAEEPVCIIMCATDLIPCYSTTIGRLELGGRVVFIPASYDKGNSAFADATCVAVNLVINGRALPKRCVILGGYEHGAALFDNCPISNQVFRASCAYNPRWNSTEAFRQTDHNVSSRAASFEYSLLIACDDSSHPIDVQRARQIGEKLQRLEYDASYYESGLANSDVVESPDDLLACGLRFLGREIGLRQASSAAMLPRALGSLV